MTQHDINKITLALATTSLELAEAKSTIDELSDALAAKKEESARVITNLRDTIAAERQSKFCLREDIKEMKARITELEAELLNMQEESNNKDAHTASVEVEANLATTLNAGADATKRAGENDV